MITIISGTNRPDSRSALVAETYSKIINDKGISCKLLKLKDLPSSFFHAAMYKEEGVSAEMIEIQENYILSAQKLIIIAPEYNGGIPGILKLFIDAMCARKYKENFSGKKISLTGVAAGRAGNLRGLEALTGILNYLGATILPNKLPLSGIEGFIDDNQINDDLSKIISGHIDQFLSF